MTRLSLAILAFVSVALAGAHAVTNPAMTDPYAWLEDIRGPKPLAWVKEQNQKSLAVLKTDPRYRKNYSSILEVLDAPDRIPTGSLDHGFVYNFWQDAKNPKGIWRRTAIADYANPSPHWDVLLDVDALAKAEKENWVFEGAECAPKQTRCLIRLSRGGGDAVVVREYDLKAHRMAEEGFTLAEAKSDVSYLDDDTVLFATNFGAGTLTKSGYARIVKLWKRGTPVAAAKTLYEGKVSDVLASSATFHTKEGDFGVVIRAVSFFESEYYAVDAAKGTVGKLDMPLSADVKGMIDGALIATLREDYAAQGAHFSKGALVAFRQGQKPQLIYAPGPRAAIESVGVGQDAIYAAVTENVIGSIHVFIHDGKAWSERKLDLPPGGAADVISVNESGPEALFNFQSYLIPPTLYFTRDQIAPGAVRCVGAGDRAIRGHLERRRQDSLFRDAAEKSLRPRACRALWLWRLRSFADPKLLRQFRPALAHPWRHLCGGEYSRWRRVRPGLA
jgi:prolyl oligopeptidase